MLFVALQRGIASLTDGRAVCATVMLLGRVGQDRRIAICTDLGARSDALMILFGKDRFRADQAGDRAVIFMHMILGGIRRYGLFTVLADERARVQIFMILVVSHVGVTVLATL